MLEKFKTALVWANGPFVFAVNFIAGHPKTTLVAWAASIIATIYFL